tara:strand:+ start:791 stop:1510 length:720 start_codon:yes stop_codon:yes gene_type:complete
MSMPFTEKELEEIATDDAPQETKENLEVEVEEQEEQEEEPDPEEDIAVQQEDQPIFEKPDYDKEDDLELPKKVKKKRKPLSEETKAKLRESLAKAREKSKQKRSAMKVLRQKNEAQEKAKAKKHIRERKKKKMIEEAHLEVSAEESIIKQEEDMWNEDKITNLMNRTLDTYFKKRKEEKKTRETFPMGPSGQPYYMPHQPAYQQTQPMRAIPKPAPVPRKPKNPYFEMFGLTAEDEDKL